LRVGVNGLATWANQITADYKRTHRGKAPAKGYVSGVMADVKRALDQERSRVRTQVGGNPDARGYGPEIDAAAFRSLQEKGRRRAPSSPSGPGSGTGNRNTADLRHLQSGVRQRVSVGAYATLGRAKATYDIPDGKNDHIVLTGVAGESASKTFRYKGKSYVITAAFEKRGEGQSGVGNVTIKQA
jgi:hypothetical protein